MAKLEKLNDEQLALIPVVRQQWLDAFFKGKSASHDKIRDGINWLYQLSGLKKPITIVVESPLAAQCVANLLKKMAGDPKIFEQVFGQVFGQVSGQVREQVREQVSGQVSGQVREQVREQVSEQVFEQVRGQVSGQVREQVFEQVRGQVREQVSEQVFEQVFGQVFGQVRGQVREQVFEQVFEQVREQVFEQVRGQVSGQVSGYFNFSGRCAWDYGWVSFYDYFNKIGIVNHEAFSQYRDMVGLGVYDSIQTVGFCVVATLPAAIRRDDKNRLHSEASPAIEWPDGYRLHYMNGVYFPEELWTGVTQRTMSAKEVLSIQNQEQKTVALRVYGYKEVLAEVKAKILDSTIVDIHGELKVYELIEADLGDDDVPARMVKVVCHSTLKETVLRVDPRIKETETVMGAIAWCAGLTEAEYVLAKET